MCGITGIIDFRKKSQPAVLESMTNTLYHRGPDGGAIKWYDGFSAQVGFGHRRLSIIDLSEFGAQPMEWGEWCICYNGEVYNYLEIKKELIDLGHTFNGNSDTEVILHAYVAWGEKALDKFIGMFAFVIYNATKETIFMARDRAGIKPFFYYWKDGLFLFSSELKAFHEHPQFQKSLSMDAVAAFMHYGNVPGEACIFEHTKKLLPGHHISISLQERDPALQAIQYWNVYDAYNQPKLILPFEEAKEETKKILLSACQYRMVADVPVGVFLSGGYDSTAVTALLQAEQTEKLKTFTIGVPDIGLNEAPYAKEVAQYLGTDHTAMECTHREALEIIPELAYFYDEPFADSSAIPTTLVSKLAKKQVTVALSADAGDEVFAGYNRYDYLMRYGAKMKKIPGFARKTMAHLMDRIPSQALPVLKHKYNFHNRYEKLKGILKNPSDEQLMLSLSQQFTPHQLTKLMKAPFQLIETAYVSKELKEYSSLSYMMAIDYQTYLVDDILHKVDRATMTASLEGREPFLDHRIIEYAAKLPDHFKYHQGEKKYILKEIVHDYVPKSMMDRPKMGFAIPIATWMQNDLRDLVESVLNEKLITEQGIFHWPYIEQLKNDFFGGKKEYDQKMWYLFTFQLWYQRWMS